MFLSYWKHKTKICGEDQFYKTYTVNDAASLEDATSLTAASGHLKRNSNRQLLHSFKKLKNLIKTWEIFLEFQSYDCIKSFFILPGVILETEGSVRKVQKKALFHYKKVKKGTPNWTSPIFIASLQLFI